MNFQENEVSVALGRLNQKLIDLKKTSEYRLGKRIILVLELLRKGRLKELFGLIKMMLTHQNKLKAEVALTAKDYVQNFKGRIAVYTCIVGLSEMIEPPYFVSENCDYYIFTDMDIPQDYVWKKIDIAMLSLPCDSPNEINRYIKLHPHEFFKDYEYSLYVDGNIQIVTDVLPMVNKMTEKEIIALHAHDRRSCAYKEAKVFFDIPRLRKFAQAADRQMAAYRERGFPEDFGLFENPIIIRKHNDLVCQEVMDLWWEQLVTYSMRDQLSLPYVLWKLKIPEDKIHIMGANLRENPRFIQIQH